MNPYIFLEGNTPIEYSIEELCELFESKQNTHFIYDDLREAQIIPNLRDGLDVFDKSLQKSNSKFTILLGGDEKPEYFDNRNNINVIYNHGHFARLIYNQTKWRNELSNYQQIKQNFTNFIIYLNCKPYDYRCKLMDEVQSTDLLEDAVWTWLMLTKNYDFKNWKPEIKYIDKDKLLEYSDENYEGYQPVRQDGLELQTNCFIQLISESTPNYFFLTEKTVKPLLHGQLFLVAGSVGFHKKLENLGFKLYDEIIDYSFDSLISYEDRVKGIIKNLQNLKNSNWNETYKKLEEKIKFNQQHLYDFAFSKDSNKELFELIDRYSESFLKLNDKNKDNYIFTTELLDEIRR